MNLIEIIMDQRATGTMVLPPCPNGKKRPFSTIIGAMKGKVDVSVL